MLFTWERAFGKWFLWEQRFKDHFIRYDFAKWFCNNQVVLDIACGTWYWTNIISKVAKRVVWMDVSEDAINHNKSNYDLPNWEFILYDWVHNPFEENYFDVVVSFETIEHIHEYDSFLSELKRVLKTWWKLIISTPNFRWEIVKNKYHVSNFTLESFVKAVSKYFIIDHVYYQWNHFYPFPGRWIAEAMFKIKKRHIYT